MCAPEDTTEKSIKANKIMNSHLAAVGLPPLQYDDVKVVLELLEQWAMSEGVDENFVGTSAFPPPYPCRSASPANSLLPHAGTFKMFYPLHNTREIDFFNQRWGNFKLLTNFWTTQLPNEGEEGLAHYHPDTVPTRQLSCIYQPVDEIRDYFGDEVAFYFAWLGTYTSSLTVPGLMGVVVRLFQPAASGGGVDANIFTLPYTIFLAMWSIGFLSTWTKRENELRFLW